jgi:glucosamine 6-phosphate synthetase-like amidotransferase/phosphosugar isomerase protein
VCGIAGFLVSSDECDVNVRGLAQDLLLDIESRGRDATGAAWFDGPTVMVQKDALPAKQFVPHLEIPNSARNVILHTRAQTQGSHRNNDNNHPVVTGGIVGVHNGGVWNDDSLFRRMGIEDQRVGEVDTEAIFAAIAYGTEINPKTGKPRLSADLLDILGEVNGSAAIAWLKVNGNPDVMELARISTSPLSFPKGSYILRALIPNQRYHNDYEPVLIERQAHEFVMIKNPEEAKTPGEVENAK